MRRSWLAAASIALALSTNLVRAHAMGAVVASPPGAAAVADVHIAVATTGPRTARWARLRVHGNATAFAWVLPARPGARVDRASDAWFEALDAATGPRVLAPQAPAGCDVIRVPEEVDSANHGRAEAPADAAVAPDEASLEAVLATWGMAVPSDLRAQLAPSFDGGAVVALLFAASGADTITASIRIVDDAPASIPLALTASPFADVNVTAYALGGQRFDLGALSPRAVDPSLVLWNQNGTSTYKTARASILSKSPAAWVIDEASGDSLFDMRALPVGEIPPLVDGYFARAAAYGDLTGDLATCVANADAQRSSALPVALACAPGSLARVRSGDTPSSCAEVVAPDTIAPDTLRCGSGSDDLAIALSGIAPAGAWITRATGVVPAGVYGSDSPLVASAASAKPPIVTASGYTFSCGGGGGSSGGTVSGGTGGSGSVSGGAGGYGGSSGGDIGATVGVDVPSDSTDDGDVAASTSGCDCGGDTSSTSDGSDGSDSSSSDSCDASSSDSSSTGCSGDSGGSSDCSATRRSRRSPMSRGVVVAALALMLIRRRTRATMRR